MRQIGDRLFGQAAANEDEVRAEAERLARQVTGRGLRLIRTTALLACVATGLSDEATMAALVSA